MRVFEHGTLAVYTLELRGPEPEPHVIPMLDPKLLRETEENLNDLMPEGYEVRIRGWDEEEK